MKGEAMIQVETVYSYDHAFTGRFMFDFWECTLSAVFWEDTVHVLLPDDKATLWKIVKEEKELLEFLKTRSTLKIIRLQFVIRFAKSDLTQGGRTAGIKTGLDWQNATHEVVHQQPATQTPCSCVLPFGAR